MLANGFICFFSLFFVESLFTFVLPTVEPGLLAVNFRQFPKA